MPPNMRAFRPSSTYWVFRYNAEGFEGFEGFEGLRFDFAAGARAA